jgi:hypothetical protein
MRGAAGRRQRQHFLLGVTVEESAVIGAGSVAILLFSVISTARTLWL